jgi:hypothetical protein
MMSVSLVGKGAQWPAICPCCGASTQNTLKSSWTEKQRVVGGTRFHTRTSKIPYCKPCQRHVPLAGASFFMWGFLAIALGAIPFMVAADSHSPGGDLFLMLILAALGGGLMWCLCTVLNILRAKRIGARCVTDQVAVQLSFQRDVDMTTFTFFNDKYADYFARLNADNRTY